MLIAMGMIDSPEEWMQYPIHEFYAFDIPFPGTCVYSLQHLTKSMNLNQHVPCYIRHRLTTEDPIIPWDFRMNIYVFPAQIEDCRITYQPI